MQQAASRTSSPSSTQSYWEFQESTPNYWEYIEDFLKDIEEKMEVEPFYINEVIYNMSNVNYKVRVGLSATCNFTPCVKIICHNTNITFDNIQWNDFMGRLFQQFSVNKLNYLFEFNIGPYNISFDEVLKIESNDNNIMQLTKEMLEELLNLQNLINFRLLYLESLKFLEFYQNVLINALFIKQSGCISEDYISVIKCNILSSLILTPQCYCMLECVNLLKDKINVDLEKYKAV